MQGGRAAGTPVAKKRVSFLLLALPQRPVGPLFLGALLPVLEGSAGNIYYIHIPKLADKISGCHGARNFIGWDHATSSIRSN